MYSFSLTPCFRTPAPCPFHSYQQARALWEVNKEWRIKLEQNQDPHACIKAEHGTPSYGIGSNKLVHAPGVDTGPTARCLTYNPNMYGRSNSVPWRLHSGLESLRLHKLVQLSL